ncbi:MAG: type II toxin-antitoxin system RelE/ParE family toxin [Geminicoccaceae bacterium]
MVYRVVRSLASDRDLSLIFDFLFETHRDLGDSLENAFAKAAARIRAIANDMEALGRTPFQGTLSPEMMHGLRWVTKNRAIFYFHVEEEAATVRVLAVFFGGADHRRKMLARLAAED